MAKEITATLSVKADGGRGLGTDVISVPYVATSSFLIAGGVGHTVVVLIVT
jgi:hypothetical protein